MGLADSFLPFKECFDLLLTPSVILVTAVIAWRVQLNVLARRATWDFVAEHEQSSEWLAVAFKARRILAIRRKACDWKRFAQRWNDRKPITEDRKIEEYVVHWANRKEFVAICILNGTLHKKMYAEWWGWEYIEEWRSFAAFAEALLDTERADAQLYQNFEKLATDRCFVKYAKWPETEEIPRLDELRNKKRSQPQKVNWAQAHPSPLRTQV